MKYIQVTTNEIIYIYIYIYIIPCNIHSLKTTLGNTLGEVCENKAYLMESAKNPCRRIAWSATEDNHVVYPIYEKKKGPNVKLMPLTSTNLFLNMLQANLQVMLLKAA